jgi:hypothetical protein
MNTAKNQSFLVFLALLAALVTASWFYTGRFAPPSSSASIWFYGGLFALLTSKFVTEYRFTKPNDVIINCLAAFVAISTLHSPPHPGWWELLRWGAFICGGASLVLAWDPGREARINQSRIRTVLYRLVTRLGSADVLFSLVFVLALLSYMNVESQGARFFVIFWGITLLVANLNLGSLVQALAFGPNSKREIIGATHSFLSPSVVFCRKLMAQV